MIAFLAPATSVGHEFWHMAGTPAYLPQLLNFPKKAAMTGGLLFFAGALNQPALLPPNSPSEDQNEP